MRRKCHLIIIQIDPTWVISFCEQGSFGISLVYWYLHVLMEFLLVFNPPCLPYHCKWVFGENRWFGLWGWKLSRLCFGAAVLSSVCGPWAQVWWCRKVFPLPREQGHCMSLCQRGRCPNVIVRTCDTHDIWVFYLHCAHHQCLQPFWVVKIEEQILPGRNVLTTLEHGLCSYLWQQWRAPLSAGCGVMEAVTTALLGTASWGHGDFLGHVWNLLLQGITALQCCAAACSGLGRISQSSSSHHCADGRIRCRITSWAVITVCILWFSHKIPALWYCPGTDSHCPNQSVCLGGPQWSMPWVTPASHSLIYNR